MTSVLPTKLRIPQIDTYCVVRPRLMDLLDAGMRRRLTLVTAPAGYGKTTAVAAWIHGMYDKAIAASSSRSARVGAAWYSLDPEDNNFSTFFTRVVAAIEASSPDNSLSVATGVNVLSVSTETYANELVSALSQLPERVVLVLDDYHLIAEPAIHQVLQHLIQNASDSLHLVIVTRYDPPLQLARLRAQRQVAEIRVEALRITKDETAELLQIQLARPATSELVNEVQERTEGWVAGLQMAAIALHGDVDVERFLRDFHDNKNRHVMDYLFEEVWNSEPEEMRNFLLKTALLTRFSAEMAAVVTRLNVAVCQRLISELHRSNRFIVSLDAEMNWFRYHHQFQSLLVDMGHATLAAAEIDSIRIGASVWLARHGWIDEALAQYVADGRWPDAAELVESNRHDLQNREDWNRLWRWISQLPAPVVAKHPGLLLGQCWILQAQDRGAAIPPLLEQVEALLTSVVQPPGTGRTTIWRGEICALKGSWIFPETTPQQRSVLLRRSLRLLPAPTCAWVRGFGYIQYAQLMVSIGRRDAAYREVREEMDATGLASGDYRTRLHHALAVVVYLDGTLTELARIGERYLQSATENKMPAAAAWARFAIGWAQFQLCESHKAWEALLPLFDHQTVAHTASIMMAMDVIVSAAAELDRQQQAAELIEQVQQTVLQRHNIAATDELASLSAHGALLQGDHSRALAWAEQHQRSGLLQSHGSARSATGGTDALVYAKIGLATGAAEMVRNAIEPLSVYVDYSMKFGSMVRIVRGAVLLGCCYWRTDRPVQALSWMQRAVEIGVPRGFRRVFFEEGRDVASMLYLMLERNMAAESASRLLTEYAEWSGNSRTKVPREKSPSDDVITPLTEREVEVLALLAQRLTNKEIARRLEISPLTVRNHTSNIYGKLSVASRKQAITQARNLGLLPTSLPR